MLSIALLSDSKNPISAGEAILLEHMQSASGLKVREMNWQNTSPESAAVDLVIPRTTWSYYEDRDAFLTWIDTVSAKGVHVMNSPALIRWNSDKHYLADLRDRGVTVAPTTLVDKGQEFTLPHSETGWVVKPCIGASSAMVERFANNDQAGAVAYAKQLLFHSGVVLQPFIPEVMSGEVSYMFFNRTFSHAVKRTPHSKDFRNQPDYHGQEETYHPTEEEIAAAQQVLDSVREDLLYARVDTVTVNGTLTVMELELVEPYLFFEFDGASPDRFMEALRDLTKK